MKESFRFSPSKMLERARRKTMRTKTLSNPGDSLIVITNGPIELDLGPLESNDTLQLLLQYTRIDLHGFIKVWKLYNRETGVTNTLRKYDSRIIGYEAGDEIFDRPGLQVKEIGRQHISISIAEETVEIRQLSGTLPTRIRIPLFSNVRENIHQEERGRR